MGVLSDISSLATDTAAFQPRVTSAIIAQATAVGQEVLALSDPTPRDKLRYLLATDVMFNFANWVLPFSWAVAADIEYNTLDPFDDTVISTSVANLWDFVAKVPI